MNLHIHTAPLFAALALAPMSGTPQAPAGSLRQHVNRDDDGADEQDARDDPSSQPELKDPARWRERLSNDALDQREREYEALLAEARKDPRGRNTLEAWSKDDRHPEFAWTCRLALRELERSRSLWPGGRAQGGNGSGLWQQLPGWPQDPSELFDPFRSGSPGLDLFFQNPDAFAAPGNAQDSSQSESFSLQVTPDGVKCTVTRDVDGKQETQEYEAKSVEDLLRDHPELERHLGRGGQAFSFQLGPGGAWPGFGQGQLLPGFGNGRLPRTLNGAGDADRAGSMRTDVLGVYVRAVTDADASHGELDEGVGLYVESVARNTLAERLGVEAGQTLVELDGRTLRTRDDIREALAARAPDAELKLTLIDRFGERHTRSWRPDRRADTSKEAPDADSSKAKDRPASKLRNL